MRVSSCFFRYSHILLALQVVLVSTATVALTIRSWSNSTDCSGSADINQTKTMYLGQCFPYSSTCYNTLSANTTVSYDYCVVTGNTLNCGPSGCLDYGCTVGCSSNLTASNGACTAQNGGGSTLTTWAESPNSASEVAASCYAVLASAIVIITV